MPPEECDIEKNPSATVSKFRQFPPDCFYSFMPLAVSHLSIRFMVGVTQITVVQFLKVSDLGAETPNSFARHCETTDSTPSSRLLCRHAEVDHFST